MNAGDKVKLLYEDKELEGTLLPRPEILEKGITIIKLNNGYNVGLEEKKIKDMKVIEKYAPPKPKETEVKHDKNLPSITIISTGGTISSRIDYRTGGVIADYTAEDFVQMMPDLAKVANLKAKKIMSVMSEDINPSHWQKIAEEIQKELKTANGVVITMGTDTLHFATAALSFFLQDLNKPVVVTASQRSIDRGSSDAFMNLFCSVAAAANAKIAEVVTCMHGSENDDYCYLIRGTKVRKMHTSRRDAFRPINDLPLAKVLPDGKIEMLTDNFKEAKTGETKLVTHFEPKTALLYVYPGMDPDIINYYLDNGYKGIVIAATALGHVAVNGDKSLMDVLKKAMDKKIPIVIASQTLYGRTHPFVYSNLRKLSIERNCIFVEDMLPEVAYIKLGWVLGKTNDIEEIKSLMQTNIAGEITERSFPKTFLA